MELFPIGTIANSSDSGTIDGISYSFFEPNSGCNSFRQYNILSSLFQNKVMSTRKKTEPVLNIEYSYDNIFDREFRQIEHFFDNVEESLTSFYVVDFSKGQTPSSVTVSGDDWVVAIKDTFLFSAVANYKANRALIKYGKSWKEGTISALTTNTSITVDVEYGNLALASANLYGMVYPIYEVYAVANSIANLQTTVFIKDTINILDIGGWMRSGKITFTSKYKV